MSDLDLVRQLRQLRRTVVMLETELRNGRVDRQLLADLDRHMETISLDPRCAAQRDQVDHLRESTLTPRPELFRDAVRVCEKLKDAIEEVVGRMK